MRITTDQNGITIKIAESQWPYLKMYPNHFLQAWTAILPRQTSAFLASGVTQTFVLRDPWAGAPPAADRSNKQAIHIGIESSSAIEEDLPAQTASIYSALGSRDDVVYSYGSPKGSVQPDEWLAVLIDCAKDASKVLVGIVAKAVVDYYRSRKTKSKEAARVVVLYGPNAEVYKKFTVEGDGQDAKTMEKID